MIRPPPRSPPYPYTTLFRSATPVANLAPGATIDCTASHTIVQADLDTGSFYNQACVDDGTGGAAAACDDVTTPGSPNPHLTINIGSTHTCTPATRAVHIPSF